MGQICLRFYSFQVQNNYIQKVTTYFKVTISMAKNKMDQKTIHEKQPKTNKREEKEEYIELTKRTKELRRAKFREIITYLNNGSNRNKCKKYRQDQKNQKCFIKKIISQPLTHKNISRKVNSETLPKIKTYEIRAALPPIKK